MQLDSHRQEELVSDDIMASHTHSDCTIGKALGIRLGCCSGACAQKVVGVWWVSFVIWSLVL